MSSPSEQLETARADLESFHRVSHRLAKIDSIQRLEQVLDKLLPKLLARIGENHRQLVSTTTSKDDSRQLAALYQQLHAKLLELVNHIMQRVQHEGTLPVLGILQLFSSAAAATNNNMLTQQLALPFLKLGLPRCTQVYPLVPQFWALQTLHVSTNARKSQSQQMAHLFLTCLEQMTRQPIVPEEWEQVKTQIQSQMMDTNQQAVIFDLLADALLYQPNTANSNLPTSGLSQAGQERLNPTVAATNSVVTTSLKLTLLDLICPTKSWNLLLSNEKSNEGLAQTLVLLVLASGNASKEVADAASGFLKLYMDTHAEEVTRTVAQLVAITLLIFGTGQAQQITNQDGWLGSCLEETGATPQQLLSLRRRPVTDHTLAAVLNFTTRLLQDQPRLLEVMDVNGVSSGNFPSLFASLAVRLIQTTLKGCTSVSGLSQLRAKPYIAAAQLLGVLSARLVTLPGEVVEDASLLLEQISTIACSVLNPVVAQALTTSTGSNTNTLSEGNWAVRDACYGVLCTLTRHSSESFGENSIATATLLFGCAAQEQERLRPRAVAALDALLASHVRVYAAASTKSANNAPVSSMVDPTNPWATATNDDMDVEVSSKPPIDESKLTGSLLPLLWNAAQSHKPKASRVAAARWAGELLTGLDRTSACHLLCFLAGDSDSTAASLAREGLGLGEDTAATMATDFTPFVRAVFVETKHTSFRSQHYWDFSFQGKAIALRFGMHCLMNDLYGGSDDSIEIYLDALTECLAQFETTTTTHASIDLLDECASCLKNLLSSSVYAGCRLLSKKNFNFSNVQELTLHVNSSRARRHLAGACGQLLENIELWKDVGGETEWASQVRDTLSKCADILLENTTSIVSRVHGSAFLGAHSVRAFIMHPDNASEDCWTKAAAILKSLGKGSLHVDELIGNSCSDSISIALSFDGKDSPILDIRLFESCTALLLDLSQANIKFSKTDHLDPSRVVKSAGAAGMSLAATTTAIGSTAEEGSHHRSALLSARLECADSLFDTLGSMAFRKQEEVAIVAGEALAYYADAYSPSELAWPGELKDWPSEYDAEFSKGLPPHEHVLYTLICHVLPSSSPQRRTATAPALLAIAARAARGINNDCAYADRVLVRALLKHLEKVQGTFISLLSDPKSKHLCRESCCLGLAACRGLLRSKSDGNIQVTEELNNKLLRAFGRTTNFAGSAMMETQAQAAQRRREEAVARTVESEAAEDDEASGNPSEVGGASGIGEAALGAYREMASASVSLGRPDILYTLLMLSVSHAYWFASETKHLYSAVALLGEDLVTGNGANSPEIKDVLRPHLGKLLPRILRAKHDPNPQTREQMNALWANLTGGGADARSAISHHLLPTIDSLLSETSSKLWRVRFGSCCGLAEIIVGRDWNELGGGGPVLNDDDLYSGGAIRSAGVRLLCLWRVSMRALDDVRITVRESGGTLARSLRGLTIRLCDPATLEKANQAKRAKGDLVSQESDATAAAATSLRWLIRHGLNQHAEGTGICISTLVDVVGLVTPKILEPIMPDLLRSLLIAISGLEPAAFNYMQLRTNNQEGMERARLQLAQSGPIADAVAKCLELTPGASLKTQQRVVVELDSALRQSSGFATRAATADAVNTLCNSCPSAFRFQGPNSLNPAVRLLRAFYYASERERSPASRDRLIHALGSLASLCPGSSVRSLAMKACQKYKRSTGSNDDPASRKAAGAALRSIAVRATNQLADGGTADIWCRIVLPVAFLGRKDPDIKISALWSDVWGEANAATGNREALGTTLEENLLDDLVRECVSSLEDVVWSRRIAGCNALMDLVDLGVLAPLSPSAFSKNGSSAAFIMVRSQQRARSARLALENCVLLIQKPRLWNGKSEAVKAASKLAGVWTTAFLEEDVDRHLVLGVETPDLASSCSWIPLSISAGFAGDLFLGDGYYFKNHAPAPDEAEEPTTNGADLDEDEEVGAMDMEPLDDTEEDEVESALLVSSVETGQNTLSFVGLCRLLFAEAMSKTSSSHNLEVLLPYRKSCFDSLSSLLTRIPASNDEVSMQVYAVVSEALLDMIRSSTNHDGQGKEPPVLTAAAMNCIGSLLWHGIGKRNCVGSDTLALAKLIADAGGKSQPAWTVRQASANCLANLASRCEASIFRQYAFISCAMESASYCFTDRKFWRVRHAGLVLVKSLVERAGTCAKTDTDQQLVLEALLPHKEVIVKQVKSCLRDPESQVTALASEVLSSISWWP